jgi:hypothetical protein
MAISVAICAGSHLIPSISKTKLAWFLWVLCMVGAVYSHITFFSFAKLRANDDRSQYSIQKKAYFGLAQTQRIWLGLAWMNGMASAPTMCDRT